MSKEALKLALEALEDIGDEWGFTSQRTVPKRKEAITAIKAALEAKDEPDHSDELTIAYMSGLHRGKEVAQRTWVGLTDEDEIDWEEGGNLKDLVKAIEARLKQKNGNA
jgi:hypothetical protein